MQAAFVDVGLERAAFLHVSDIAVSSGMPKTDNIHELLREGQFVVVQVLKDPIGTKSYNFV